MVSVSLKMPARLAVQVRAAARERGLSKSAPMSKYRNVPMSVADACLVRMSELHRGSLVLTVDRDFAIYRRKRTHPIPLLSPGISPSGSISSE